MTMNRLNPDRAQARRMVRVFQAAVAVLFLAAATVAALTVTSPTPAPRLPPLEATTPAARSGAGSATPKVESEAIAVRFNQIPNRPVVRESEQTTATSETPPPPVDDSLAAHVRYLGPVMSGKTMMALIAVDNRQRFVSVGDVFSIGPPELGRRVRVVSISPEAIVLDEGKGSVTISRAERSGLAVGRSSSPSGQPMNPTGVPAPRMPVGASTFHQGPGGVVTMQPGASGGVERRELAEKMRLLELQREMEQAGLMAEKLGEPGRGSPDSVGLDDGKGGGPK